MAPCVSNSLSSFHIIQDVDDDIDCVERAQTADFETAVHYAGQGKFQTVLLVVTGCIYATCAISTTTLSFVLPSAECDFSMSSADKGKLSAMPLIGMIVGCTIWGSIADCYGRKWTIVLSLLVDFIAAVVSSQAHGFSMFLVCRFFNGFGIIGATSLIFTYLGEFLPQSRRDIMLGRLEIFWTIGIMILPGIGWIFLSQRFANSFAFHQNFSPWRMFVIVCSLPSLVSFIMLCFFPETPKFLMSKGNYGGARHVFQKIYSSNTGESMYLYPILNFEGEFLIDNNNSIKLLNRWRLIPRLIRKCKKMSEMLLTLCSQPYLKFIAITGFADFGLMASYYTLIMWFPEIFERFHDFEVTYPGNSGSICTVSQNSSDEDSIFQYSFPCDPSVEDRVFLDTGIIGVSCIPTAVLLGYLMHKFGKKIVLISGLIISGISTLSLNFVRNSTETLVVSCIFEAFTSILEAVLFCVVVDLFPTNLRAIAVALTATSGRLGAIFGNIIFGILIDLNCVVPIYLFGFLLIASGLLCLAIPRKENYTIID